MQRPEWFIPLLLSARGARGASLREVMSIVSVFTFWVGYKHLIEFLPLHLHHCYNLDTSQVLNIHRRYQ